MFRSILPACAALLFVLPALPALGATIEVHVSPVAAKGKVMVAVCDRERFLKQCAYTASGAAQPGETVLKVEGVPKGSWAVLAFQDENGNGQLDRNFIGIPSENYGFSRDARGKFGPPSFDDAAFEVKEETAVANVKLR